MACQELAADSPFACMNIAGYRKFLSNDGDGWQMDRRQMAGGWQLRSDKATLSHFSGRLLSGRRSLASPDGRLVFVGEWPFVAIRVSRRARCSFALGAVRLATQVGGWPAIGQTSEVCCG